ncbi:MAG: hypothetical protein ACLVK6_00760 [Lachnospiraceae bacterium]
MLSTFKPEGNLNSMGTESAFFRVTKAPPFPALTTASTVPITLLSISVTETLTSIVPFISVSKTVIPFESAFISIAFAFVAVSRLTVALPPNAHAVSPFTGTAVRSIISDMMNAINFRFTLSPPITRIIYIYS